MSQQISWRYDCHSLILIELTLFVLSVTFFYLTFALELFNPSGLTRD